MQLAGDPGGARPGRRRLRVLLLITEDWYFWSHRRGLAAALVEAGHEVVLATRIGELRDSIEALGVRVEPIVMARAGRNPFGEVRAVAELYRLYRRLRPDLVHHVGVKPMLYGSWAALAAGIGAVVNAQPGFGYVFTARGAKASLIRACVLAAYRSAWRGRRTRVIFQNAETMDFFVRRGVIAADAAVLIRGTGVDLDEFAAAPEPAGEHVVMLTGRLLWDKGIGELVEAVRSLREAGRRLRLVLVGRPDPANPKAVDEAQLARWQAAGDLEWWGHRRDVAAALASAHVVALPSYAEGLPKSLVEAAAVGRAIVATDVPGCREVVRDGVNGLLVPPRDAARLAAAIAALLDDAGLRARMGAAGRQIAEQEFSSERITGEVRELFEGLASR